MRDVIARRFCYSKRYNFTYQRVPKAANSTIVRTLAAHMPEIVALGEDPKGVVAKRRLRALPSRKAFDGSFSFSFIRDPALRVLSAWQDKAHDSGFQRRHDLVPHDGRSGAVTFTEFLERLEDGLLSKDLHWRPQADILLESGQCFRFLGRVERMDVDLPHVIETIFGRFQGTQTRMPGRTGAGRARLAEVANAADLARIERLYAADFELYETTARGDA